MSAEDFEELDIREAIATAREKSDLSGELAARERLETFNQRRRAASAPPPPPPGLPSLVEAQDLPFVDPNVQEMPQPPKAGAPTAPVSTTDIARRQQMEQERIVPGSAPAAVRAAASFGMDDVEAYQLRLGPDYEVKRVTSEGPMKGEVVFRRKGTEDGFQSVRGAGQGLNFGDIASLTGELLPSIGGGVGGVLGFYTPTAPALGSIAGTGVGSFVGDYARLLEGRRRGVVPADTTDVRLIYEAMKRSGLDMLGAAGGTIVYRAIKAFAGRGLPDLGMSPEQLLKELQAVRDKLGAGAENLVTPGMLVGKTPTGAVVAEAERVLAKQEGPQGDAMRAILQGRETFGREAAKQAIEPPPATGGVTQTAEAIEKALPQPEAALKAMGGEIHPDLPITGQGVRKAVEKAYDDAINPVRAEFKSVSQAAQGENILPTDTRDALVNLYSRFGEEILPGLSRDTNALVMRALDKIYVRVEPDAPRVLSPVTYDQIAEALSAVRKAKRDIFKGEWKGIPDQLDEIEKGLIADRARLIGQLPDGKEIAAQLAKAEVDYRNIQTAFKREAIADLFKHKVGGAEVLSPNRVTAKLFADPEAAAAVGKVLREPEFAPIREAVRSTLRWEASAAALKGGRVQADALEKFIKQNEVVLSNFFSPNEISRLSRVPQMARLRQAMGFKEGQNYTAWFDDLWSKGDVRSTEQLIARLRQQDPQSLEGLKGLVRQRLYIDMMEEGKQATGGAVNVDALGKLLNQPGRTEWLSLFYDPGFPIRLRNLNEAMMTLIPVAQKVNIAKDAGAETSFGALKRLGRVVLGPLTKEGRVYNNLLSMTQDRVKTRAAEALLDPERFAQLVAASKRTPGGTVGAAALGQALFTENLASQGRQAALGAAGNISNPIQAITGGQQ